MSDLPNGNVSAPAGEGQPVTPSQNGGGEGAAPQPITRQELLDLMSQQQQEISRMVQSRTDASESRIQKRIREQMEATKNAQQLLQQAGVQIDPSAMQRVADQIIRDAYIQPEPAQPSAPAAQPVQQEVAPEVMAANTMAEYLESKYGIGLDVNDPEAAALNNPGLSPQQWIGAYEQALTAKKARLNTPPEARVPSMGQGQSTNLAADYQRELAAIPRGNVGAVFQLKLKYRKMGLPG